MKKLIAFLALACALPLASAFAAEVSVPRQATAGAALSIPTSGSGEATVVVVGPAHIVSKKVQLGQPLDLTPDDVSDAGRYTVIVDGDNSSAKSFFVNPAKPGRLGFVAHPSRAPVSQQGGITGAIYAFDTFNNLILQPLPVTFTLAQPKAGATTRQVTTRDGVAFVALDSPRTEGPVTFTATAGDVKTQRAVRVVADEPCTLRIHAQPAKAGQLEIATEPVKDCSGNLVPDGTMVTFTEWDEQGRSTVDAAVKKGVAKATLPAKGNVRISAASGVAMGNELTLREQ
jgi:hypothetical protein